MKQGKWICYPGDYEIMLSEKVQSRRYQHGFMITPFWRVDSPWHNVTFRKTFVLDKPATLRFSWEGEISVFLMRPVYEQDDYYSFEFDGVLELPAGEHKLTVWVYNPNGLPCLKIDGDQIVTDKDFMVGNNEIDWYPAGVCSCGDLTPNTFVLPTRPIDYVRKFDYEGDVVYDFGKMVFSFVTVRGVGDYKLFFGETLAETVNDISKTSVIAYKPYFGKSEKDYREFFCEQAEKFTLKDGESHRSEVSKAFRYLRVKGGACEIFVEEEYDPTPVVCDYKADDQTLKRIFDISSYTFNMCAREFYLDGAKRDRWVWGGDTYQAAKAECYYQFNTERIKNSIIALFGKSPVKRYINHIMDYTFYIIMATWEYYQHTGDIEFLKFIEPILTEHLEFCFTRLSEDGFICSVPLNGKHVDWIFVDWGELPNRYGEVSSEQILFWAALNSAAEIYKTLGIDNKKLLSFASDLKDRTDKIFWSKKDNAYIFARNNGVLDGNITCHANVFAVLFGFVDGQKKKAITDGIISGKIDLSITPFMIEFVLSALFEAGEWKDASKHLKNYWGGMAKQDTSTFWETYVEGEEMESATNMYGRPFGRSKCHIWGAGPLYLIPRYYYGIKTDVELGEKFIVSPHIELIENTEYVTPLKRGTLKIICKDGVITVYSTELDGTLEVNGKSYIVSAKKETVVRYR